MASTTSPTQIVNQALARLGHVERISSIYEGTRMAEVALDLYGQTRDATLREKDWPFAQRTVTLAPLKTAPAGGYIPPTVWNTNFPPVPWQYEYPYPSDCLKIRSLKLAPIFLPNYDPQPVVMQEANDYAFSPAQKVILCMEGPSLLLNYTGQIVDPATWEPLFVETLVTALKERLAEALTAMTQMALAEAKESEQLENMVLNQAASVEG